MVSKHHSPNQCHIHQFKILFANTHTHTQREKQTNTQAYMCALKRNLNTESYKNSNNTGEYELATIKRCHLANILFREHKQTNI